MNTKFGMAKALYFALLAEAVRYLYSQIVKIIATPLGDSYEMSKISRCPLLVHNVPNYKHVVQNFEKWRSNRFPSPMLNLSVLSERVYG